MTDPSIIDANMPDQQDESSSIKAHSTDRAPADPTRNRNELSSSGEDADGHWHNTNGPILIGHINVQYEEEIRNVDKLFAKDMEQLPIQDTFNVIRLCDLPPDLQEAHNPPHHERIILSKQFGIPDLDLRVEVKMAVPDTDIGHKYHHWVHDQADAQDLQQQQPSSTFNSQDTIIRTDLLRFQDYLTIHGKESMRNFFASIQEHGTPYQPVTKVYSRHEKIGRGYSRIGIVYTSRA